MSGKQWVTFPSGRIGFYADVASRPRSPEKPEGYVYPQPTCGEATFHWLWVIGHPRGRKDDFSSSGIRESGLYRRVDGTYSWKACRR
jgi:hypothetical protein